MSRKMNHEAMYDVDYKVLMQLKACRDKLKPQQYRTIRGQIFSGDTKGAIKGLQRILKKDCGNEFSKGG